MEEVGEAAGGASWGVKLRVHLFWQVYGCQPTWKKWVKRLAGRGTEEKFDEVVQQLGQITQQIWALQETGDSQGRTSSR